MLREIGGGLTVVFGAKLSPRVQWTDVAAAGAAHTVFLRNGQLTLGGRTTYANPAVVLALRRARPDVVILGGFAPWIYAAAASCRMARVPYLIWSGETRDSRAATRIRRVARMPLVAGADGFLAYGPAAAEYLTDLGIPDGNVTVVGNGIDFRAFASRVDAAAEAGRALRRRVIGSADKLVLAVGAKGLDLATAAVQRVEAATLLVAGSSVAGAADAYVDLGRLRSDEMPAVYAAADALVHVPEADQWPHAINEAIAAGIPVVAAPRTGVPDEMLAGPGCAVVARQVDAIATALTTAVDIGGNADPSVRDTIRERALDWDVEHMASRIVAAAVSTLE